MEAIRLHAMLSTFACGFAIDKWSRTGLIPRLTDGKFVDRTLSLLIERRISGRDSLMKMLSQEEIMEFRNEIANFDISESRKDEIIHFLDAVASSFVQQAFLKSSVQLSLSDRANYAFNGAETRARLPESDVSELVDLDSEGAINTNGPERQLAP
jgi:hypothetical protein